MLLGEKIVGRGSRGREGLGIGLRPEAGGLREAIETLVSSWTLVIGAKAGPRRDLYDGREFILDQGGSSRGGALKEKKRAPAWQKKTTKNANPEPEKI